MSGLLDLVQRGWTWAGCRLAPTHQRPVYQLRIIRRGMHSEGLTPRQQRTIRTPNARLQVRSGIYTKYISIRSSTTTGLACSRRRQTDRLARLRDASLVI